MNLKKDIDAYFNKHYKQLESTTNKIIKKYDRHLDSSNVLSACYLYVMSKQKEIIAFSKLYGKEIEHVIYSFVKRFINNNIMWERSELNRENDRLHNKTISIDNIFVQNEFHYEDNENETYFTKFLSLKDDERNYMPNIPVVEMEDKINTEDFIKSFYESLNKLDAICFKVYYYDGLDNAKDFAEHFGFSESNAYGTFKRLRTLLSQYIINKKIFT